MDFLEQLLARLPAEPAPVRGLWIGPYWTAVQTDRGAVESARLQLDFTQIRAPISGRLGLRQVEFVIQKCPLAELPRTSQAAT